MDQIIDFLIGLRRLGGLGTTQLGLGGLGYGGLGGLGSLGSLGGLGNIGVGNLGNIGIGGAGNIGLGVGVPQQIRYQEINSVPLGILQPYGEDASM